MATDEILKREDRFGVYLHIPFCASLCHYCDFAKTANWDNPLVKKYFEALEKRLKNWAEYISGRDQIPEKISSFFWGGGTPGLFAKEMVPHFEILRPFFSEHCEISLEANPDNFTAEKLDIWKNLGFTRISIGIQTFDDLGLSFLKRDHSSDVGAKAVKLAINKISSVNLDLIYGWPGQTFKSWKNDLKIAVDLGVHHLSLYNLIYEAGTPIGRQLSRGKIDPVDEDSEVDFYEFACKFLADAGFIQDEVSNWAKPGHSCSHNWLYWQGSPYVGIGSGAHGFLKDQGTIGVRYHYDRSERKFAEDFEASVDDLQALLDPSQNSQETDRPDFEIEERDKESWLTEYIGCGLRCRFGVDLNAAEAGSETIFSPKGEILKAIETGTLAVSPERRLTLVASEWIRETYWSLGVLACFDS